MICSIQLLLLHDFDPFFCFASDIATKLEFTCCLRYTNFFTCETSLAGFMLLESCVELFLVRVSLHGGHSRSHQLRQSFIHGGLPTGLGKWY